VYPFMPREIGLRELCSTIGDDADVGHNISI
jgi:hypothetical protein